MLFRRLPFALVTLVLLTSAVGCTPETGRGPKHSFHAHTAPHGGTLVVLSEEFLHIEFVLDAPKGELRAYILDSHAENPVRSTQGVIELQVKTESETFPVKLLGVTSPLSGETENDTSEFAAQDDRLKGQSKFKATVARVEAKGQVFTNLEFPFPEGTDPHQNQDQDPEQSQNQDQNQ